MKVDVGFASSDRKNDEVEITTLEDLLSLLDKYDESLILSKDADGSISLLVYDYYIE